MTPLHTLGTRFIDAHGRQVILRGVNLGGDCKLPFPDGGTQHPTDFADHRTVSFVGRPFPLDEADEHLARLAHWGFNCVRLLTTWEAVEHAGPGQYDSDYLDYFAQICRRAGAHGLNVFIDFHQDVWSRMSGGDGAPGWVFEALGIDFTRLHAAGAAHVMQHAYDYGSDERHQAGYPTMSWASNYKRPANGILWTLFWGGRHFTPDFQVQGRNVQDFLQDHLLGAMDAVAQRVKAMQHVIGFDSLNEPGTGWLGQLLHPAPLQVGQPVPMPALPGLVWSPLQALAVARGLPTELPFVGPSATGGLVVQGLQTVNPGGVSIWREGMVCPFEAAGLYRVQDGALQSLDPGVFQHWGERRLSIPDDAFGPFFHRVANTVRQHAPHWLLFAEIDPLGNLAGRPFPSCMPTNWVNASHWYDLTLLLRKQFDVQAHADLITGDIARGADAVRQRYVAQLTRAMQPARAAPGGVPTLIGEFGIPYDLHRAQAYANWAGGARDAQPWQAHTLALSLMYDALDQLQLSSTQWNYTASNRNDARIGDGWNQEDLSIYSADQADESAGLDSGGRAVAGFCRPYARAVQGRLQMLRFEPEAGCLTLAFEADAGLTEPTEVFLPRRHFPAGVRIDVAGASVRQQFDAPTQSLRLWAAADGVVRVTVTVSGTGASHPVAGSRTCA
jgi:hypothetical protein